MSVVIPVLDEEPLIHRCHAELTRVLAASSLDYELIFVDDGSSDSSWERMRELAAWDPTVTCIKLSRHVGQQPALRAGLHASSGAAVVTYDADLQFPPECIPDLVAKIFEGYDIGGGVRESRRDPLLLQRIPSRLGRFLVNRALLVRVRDFGAVKAYSRRIVDQICAMTKANVILPAAALSMSRNFIEIPIGHRPREIGRTKWSLLSRMELYFDIYTSYSQRPFQSMMVAGFLGFGMSGLCLLAILAHWWFVSGELPATLLFFDVLLLFAGLNLLSLSLIGEFAVRSYRESRTPLAEQMIESVIGQRTGRSDDDDPDGAQSR